MTKETKLYTYHVTLDIPNSMKTHDEVDVVAPNQFEAKCKATVRMFNHQFTGVHKYMKAVRVAEGD